MVYYRSAANSPPSTTAEPTAMTMQGTEPKMAGLGFHHASGAPGRGQPAYDPVRFVKWAKRQAARAAVQR